MSNFKLLAALVAIVVLAAPTIAVSTEQAKAPFVTDAAQAKADAAESGKHALIYFFSPT